MSIKLQVNKKTLKAIFMLIPFFEPGTIDLMISNNGSILWNLLGYWFSISRIAITIYIVYRFRREKITSTTYSIFFFLIIRIVISFFNGSSIWNILLGSFTLVGLVFVCELLIRDSIKRFYTSIIIIFGCYSIINAITTIMLPYGFYNDQIATYGTAYGVYFLGSKNSSFFYYLIFLFTLYLTKTEANEKLPKCGSLFTIIFFIAAYLVDSSGTMIGLLIMLAYYYLNKFNKQFYKLLRPKTLVLLVAIISIVVLAGVNSNILSNVVRIFNRNMTFTGRTILWKQAIDGFIKKPFLGNGSGFEYILIQNIRKYTQAHSVYLDMLAKYGIFTFSSFIFIIIVLVQNISKVKNRQSVSLAATVLFATFLHCIIDDMSLYMLFLIYMLSQSLKMSEKIVSLENNKREYCL